MLYRRVVAFGAPNGRQEGGEREQWKVYGIPLSLGLKTSVIYFMSLPPRGMNVVKMIRREVYLTRDARLPVLLRK